ncbi:MAG: phosphoribosylglycinamide formyltransferase [Sideroxyarcus sp.]|nr:phosphoribosylglycinamide formyltransferase [Sideroxyarcus sp.]
MSRKIAVFISGSGSNLQAIIDAIDDGRLDASIAVVVSNTPDAYGLQRAATHHIPTLVVQPTTGETRDQYSAKLVTAIAPYTPSLICLAGFMKLLGEPILQAYPRRIINIHPSLLPAYPGLDVIARAFSDRTSVTGCTIHYVDGGMDTGPIIAQARVPLHADDTLASLTERIHTAEHALYPVTIQKVLDHITAS